MGRKQIPLLKRGKHKKHDTIVNDFDIQKTKHLEKLATKMINEQDKIKKLKSKNINPNFLNLF